MPTVTVESLLDKKDYLDFCRFRSYYMSNGSRNLIVFPAVLLVFAIINAVLKNGWLAAVLVVLAVLIPLWMMLNVRLYARKDVLRFELSKPRVFYTLRFEKSGVHVENETEAADYPWKQIWKIYRTKRFFYVYMTPQRGFIVPLRCFEKGEADTVWGLAEEMMPKRLVEKTPWYEK